MAVESQLVIGMCVRECKKIDGVGMRIKAVAVGLVLAGTALGSAALNLGRARGAAWIGQPLELMVAVQIDPGQADGALCAEADVFHGDSRQDNSRVQVHVTPTDQPDTFNLKISSSALIDEPVVTVYLRVGCAQKISRKYVLLADFPSETAPPLSRSGGATAPQLSLVMPVEESRGAPAAPSSPKAAQPPKAAQKVIKPSVSSQSAQSVAQEPAKERKHLAQNPAKSEKPADTGKPRLHLDPVETLNERVKSLESSTKGAIPTEDAGRDSQRMQLLQNDMKVLLEQALKNEASLATMRARLERAESDRVPVEAVYGLGALVLLCLGALALIWGKGSRPAAWTRPLARNKGFFATATDAASEEEDFAVNTEDVDKAAFDALVAKQSAMPVTLAVNKVPKKYSATRQSRKDFNADYQVDLRQQADFLAKLGKVDEAIEVLDGGTHSNPKESPLLFLDLLAIAENFNREVALRQYREQFMQLFNVRVPDLALGNDEGRSLDAYPALLDHINNQWESPHVLDVIEACIMRDPEASESDPFDLAAFRELVNMHGIASEHHRHTKA